MDKLPKFQLRLPRLRSGAPRAIGFKIGKEPTKIAADANYVRVRKGSMVDDTICNAALYVRLDLDSMIERKKLYVLGLTLPDMPYVLHGGSWISSKDLVALGLPGYRLPKEPVAF